MGKLEQLIRHWGKIILGYLPKVILAILVFVVFYFAAKQVKRIGQKVYSRTFKTKKPLANLVTYVIYFLCLFFGIFLSLEILGLDSVLSKLIAGAGIVGIVVGFAFKQIASNFIAGFLLNIQKPFDLGDWVDINGEFGKIIEMGSITTSIKTADGQNVYVPNHLIYQDTFKNFSTYSKRRVVMKTGVSYGDDLEHVKTVAIDEVKKINLLLKDEDIDFYYTSIGSSAYNFEVRFWIEFQEQKDYLEAMSELIMRIKKRFEEENISIAYSVTTLDFGVKGGTNIFDKGIQIKDND